MVVEEVGAGGGGWPEIYEERGGNSELGGGV